MCLAWEYFGQHQGLQEHRRLQSAQVEARNEKQKCEAQQALKSAAAAFAEKQKTVQERVKKELAEEVAQKVPKSRPCLTKMAQIINGY